MKKQVIKQLQDSIFKLKTNNATEIVKFQSQVNVLEKDKDNLNKKIKVFENDIASFNKNSVKNEIFFKNVSRETIHLIIIFIV